MGPSTHLSLFFVCRSPGLSPPPPPPPPHVCASVPPHPRPPDRPQRLLERPDTLAALELHTSGGRATDAWQGKGLQAVSDADVDALLARLPDYQELTLPLRHTYRDAEVKAAEMAVWEEKYASYLESGEAPGYFGTLMRNRYWWV
jgi:hypothetical protein